MQLRSLLGSAQGSQVTLAVDDDALGDRARRAGAPVAAGGGVPRSRRRSRCPAPPGAAARSRAGRGHPRCRRRPRRCCCSRRRRRPRHSRGNSPSLGFTGTVATDDDVRTSRPHRRWPTASPCSCRTRPSSSGRAANRRLAADVESFAPGTKLTPGVAAGYWSADAFLAVLAKVGKHLTARPVRRGGQRRASRSPFPAPSDARRGRRCTPRACPCGALVQSDGSRYLVVEPYRCGEPVVAQPTPGAPRASELSRRRRGGSRPSSSPGTRRSRRRSSRRGCR